MGCDIHMHTEIRIDGRWAHEGAGPYDDRNYDLFWVLGENTRSPGPNPPIASYRGIPEDASDFVRFEHEEWGGDAHSATWLTLAELQAWLAKHPNQVDIDDSSFWSKGMEYLSGLDAAPEDVRIVFWFDN